MSNGSTLIEKTKWEAGRTTPRGRGLVKAFVVNPGRISSPRLLSAERAKYRRKMRALYERGIKREAEIGIDPIYRMAPWASQAWRRIAKQWEKANPHLAEN